MSSGRHQTSEGETLNGVDGPTPPREDAGDVAAILDTVREFVDRDVIPVASTLERRDEYPAALVETMRELGLFGAAIPERYDGLGLSLGTYAQIVIELARGWMSLTGVLNTHFVPAWMIARFGTDEQRETILPRMASGEIRGAFAMTEPHAGSDLQAIRTVARRNGDGYRLSGQKMWITNAQRAGLVMVLAKTDPDARPAHRGMTAFIVEKEPGATSAPGLTVSPPLAKLGYKGVETTELAFDALAVPGSRVLGGERGVGKGFAQFMAAIELGRINVGARGVGVAQAALDAAIAYGSERETFGRPITDHQAIQLKLAGMATKLRAARLLVLDAANRKDAGERTDLEAGMAKLFATETAQEVVLEAMRIHGGYGYSPEYVVERLYRDTPLLLIGEGTNEIQQLVIARRLLERARGGSPRSPESQTNDNQER